MKYYDNFNTKEVDGQSLIHLINLLPNESLIGAEIGVMFAKSFCTFLQQCPKIKKMYGVDFYKPYTDYLKIVYDGTPGYSFDEKASENIKLVAMHNIKWSGYAEKVKFLEMDSTDATNLILDGELDFIFLDRYTTPQQVYKDLNDWYDKVKIGGIFAGHDWNCDSVREAVNKFRLEKKITSTMSCFDNTWVWIK